MKTWFLVLFIISVSTSSLAQNTHGWFSLSGLWGQGETGIVFKHKLVSYFLRYSFVLDWTEQDFTYHQVAPAVEYGPYSFGLRYRCQLNQNEYTPYLSYFKPFYFKYPISIYNEAEYRINSVIKDNYCRTRHIVTLYAPKIFQEKYFVKPYVAIDSFVDWDEMVFEKNRLNFGYFIVINHMQARAYVIPWSNGVKEEEWNDKNRFGASIAYSW